MRALTTEEDLFLATHRAQLRALVAEIEGGASEAGPQNGKLQMLMRGGRFGDLVSELQEQRLVDTQSEIIAAFQPYFDCPNRCRVKAQESDAFSREQRYLSAFHAGGLHGAKAALTILDAVLGE